MLADILALDPLPPLLLEPLKSAYRCHEYASAPDKRALLAQHGRAIRALVQGGAATTPTDLLDALPALEIISVLGAGYDGVPIELCRSRGIVVTHTPDLVTDDVADIALALILMTGRELIRANRFVHAGHWQERRRPELASTLAGKSVGILGLGRIGKAIAARVSALGMRVSYTGPRRQDVPYAFVPSLQALAAEVHFLVIACRGGPPTQGLVDARVLGALGAKGTLINVARGSIVDEEALIHALENGVIKAAGLDVYAHEPRIPETLLNRANVVLLPHIGSATVETRTAMADACKANLDAYFLRGPALNVIPELA